MDEHTQILTIKKTVTYIVDENGNEVEATSAPLEEQPSASREEAKD